VVAGRHDPATTLEAGEYIRDHIPGAAFAVLEAAHISNIEQPEQFTGAVLAFLTSGRP
jgi:3-oxoadipate enol-lactonase